MTSLSIPMPTLPAFRKPENWRKLSTIGLALIALAIVVFAGTDAHAVTVASGANGAVSTTGTTGSGNLLAAPVLWLQQFMKGTGGLLAALLALMWTLYEAFVSKDVKGAGVAIGVGLIAIYGPTVLGTFFGATL